MEWINENVAWIAVSAACLSLILLINVVVLQLRLANLRRKYLRMINGGRPEDMEQLLVSMQEESSRLRDDLGKTKRTLAHWQDRVRALKGYAGIYRYNAYGERGSDLSFSLAVIDEEKTGFVVSGIRNREESYVYAKPVEHGASTYKLTDEEKEAIERAIQPASASSDSRAGR